MIDDLAGLSILGTGKFVSLLCSLLWDTLFYTRHLCLFFLYP